MVLVISDKGIWKGMHGKWNDNWLVDFISLKGRRLTLIKSSSSDLPTYSVSNSSKNRLWVSNFREISYFVGWGGLIGDEFSSELVQHL